LESKFNSKDSDSGEEIDEIAPRDGATQVPLCLYTESRSGTADLIPMHDMVSLIARHGYLVIFLVVFAEAIGLPVPAAIALVAGGAYVGAG